MAFHVRGRDLGLGFLYFYDVFSQLRIVNEIRFGRLGVFWLRRQGFRFAYDHPLLGFSTAGFASFAEHFFLGDEAFFFSFLWAFLLGWVVLVPENEFLIEDHVVRKPQFGCSVQVEFLLFVLEQF